MPQRVHEEMNLKISNRLLWRTFISCLLIFDYYLFTTGNPSITYSVLGGLFWITLVAAVMIMASNAPGANETWLPFILHVFVIGLFSAVLLVTSPYAREFASVRLEAEISSFARDPVNIKADVSNEARQLMVKIRTQKFTMERETFIPSFRRMDYLLKTDTGEKYRLIMTIGWNGTPEISLRRVGN
jgi:hypothetical protein